MIDKQGFGAKYRPLSERARQLDDEIPRAQAELDFLKISYLSQEEILAEARDLHTRWPSLTSDERRQIVEAITERIVIGDGEVEINLYYAPPSSSGSNTPTGAGETDTPPRSSSLNRGRLAMNPQGFIAPTS
ncbi:MAG: Site-specific recombinase [Betaproteobacteria bacterium]|nr:Site-specific recombinase [Betaproteobacteria bacterium]